MRNFWYNYGNDVLFLSTKKGDEEKVAKKKSVAKKNASKMTAKKGGAKKTAVEKSVVKKPAPKKVAKPKKLTKKALKLLEERKRQRRYQVRVVLIVVLGFLLVLGGVMWSEIARADEYQLQQETHVTRVAENLARYYEDYEKEVPKLEFEVEGLEAIETENSYVRAKKYTKQKQEVEERIARLRKFAEVREQVEEFFQDGILKSDTDAEAITAMQETFEMGESYQKALQGRISAIKGQYQAMVDLVAAVPGMFTDEGMETVRDDLSREQYNEIKARVDSLPQRDVAERYAEVLKKVDEVLTERERIAEEARRKAEEEYRQRQAAIAAAWHTLSVPYWSQNGEGVKNGCEAASLLMGLQYKGYLGGMNLRTYAEMMPKSDDPFSGFRGDIFASAGSDAPFWIAPGPLAAFGRSSSGANVVDITGASLDALDAEVAAGNPVVIYLTLSYVAPSAWRYGAPANLHVMLLTGYNSMTGVQRVTDPLTLNGRRYYDLPRAQVESIFNSTGNRAVVIR